MDYLSSDDLGGCQRMTGVEYWNQWLGASGLSAGQLLQNYLVGVLLAAAAVRLVAHFLRPPSG